ncbi:class I SAM-dependent methyltransferase [Puniceicoccaceae bacterium K14]|nr:class I SAM-dependent methyltransferase [Puniceicoccaceae bacterium K14]
MTHDDYVPKYLRGQGAEIGAFKTPIPGISPYYIDKFDTYDGEKCLVDYLGDAVSLPFENESLDFVASSHVLEHIANPIKALLEWQRVLKPGGVVYTVIPDRRFTFDHRRELTTAEHMIDDYRKGTTDCDAVHINDFIYGIDWSQTHPDIPENEVPNHQKSHSEYYEKEVTEGREINLHFHVFEPQSFIELIGVCEKSREVQLKLKIEEVVESFPKPVANGFLAVLRKEGSVSVANQVVRKIRKLLNTGYPVKKTAKKVS